jgi:hypothetical protein
MDEDNTSGGGGSIYSRENNNVTVEMTNQTSEVTNEQVNLMVKNYSSSGSQEEGVQPKKEKRNPKTLKRQTTSNFAKESIKTMSCCRTVGSDGLVLLLSMLLLSILQFVIFYVYANPTDVRPFRKIGRPAIWIFLLFSILYFLEFVFYTVYWKYYAKKWVQSKYLNQSHPLHKIQSNVAKKVIQFYYQNLGMNGKFYFYKLYSYEFIESWVQFSNLISVYSCMVPMGWVITLILLLMFESMYRMTFMYTKLWGNINAEERNFQISLDVFTDMFFMIVPLCILWFTYKIPVTIYEILRIILMPSLSLLGKLRGLFRHAIFKNIANDIKNKENEASKSFNRRRMSLYGAGYIDIVAKEQNKRFPRFVKLLVFFLSFGYLIALSILLISQLVNTSYQNACNSKFNNTNIWKEGCEVKIPFCKSPFSPKCNCVSLNIENNYNMKTLPEQMTTEMDGLRKVHIYNGNLTALPQNMEKLVEIRDFQISFNKLKEFNVDVREWKLLVRLFLHDNNIRSYNEEALWAHPNLVSLDVSDNFGLKMPDQTIEISMPSLQYFSACNNSARMDMSFDNVKFPILTFLFVNGNNIVNFERFLDESLKVSVSEVGIARCNLRSLPPYLSNFDKLLYLDARNNNISDLDAKTLLLLGRSNVEAYFAGNPSVCRKHKSLDCEPLCSEYCYTRNNKNNYCDQMCNSEQCNYDEGECRL